MLRLGFDADPPADALVRLARTGDAGTVPVIADLLARVAAEAAADVPPEVLTAIRDLGGRLRARRRIRPVCLLDAADPGNALLAGIVLDLLDRSEVSERQQAVLLAVLGHTAGGHRQPPCGPRSTSWSTPTRWSGGRPTRRSSTMDCQPRRP